MDVPGYDFADDLGRRGPYVRRRAVRAHDGRRVLLKLASAPSATPDELDALSREFDLLRSLNVPGVPHACDLLRSATSACLVLEDRGLDPLLRLPRTGPAKLDAFFRVARHLCTTLGELHARRVVHASLCPAAVFASRGFDEVQLVDFHLARASAVPPSLAAFGPTPYMSPEQTGRIERTVDYRTDLYSLGATLYEWLTGVPPFESGDPLELIHAHLARVPVDPGMLDRSIPEQISRVVLRLLAKAAEDRYQSTIGLAHDLAECERQWRTTGTVRSFEPGTRDVPERLLVPAKLYGRDAETRQLLEAFEQAGAGARMLLLVTGYAGIGKTSLVQELFRPIVRQRGYFASGKFDQVVRDVPHGALIQALRGLVWQLLTEPEERLAQWRDTLRSEVGSAAGVLAEVVPEIELILGPQDPPPPLDPAEAQNRFRYTLRRFVGAVSGAGHPLVLFLDDLQWADAATLDMLHALLTAAEIGHLLLIGAYRDNEVGTDHPLMAAIGRLAATRARIDAIALPPLAAADLTRFLSDTLRTRAEAVAPLAELVHRKTGGNPFFGIQFLQALEQDHLVTFDRDAARWAFRLDAIARAGHTDNIIDLMTRRIRKLSSAGQRAVTLAACIGNRFDWRTFAGATRQPPDEAAAGLSEALQAGLLHLSATADAGPLREPEYAFLHDRVQQAAYALIPDDEKELVHLDVGRLLLDVYGGEVPDEMTFAIANHLNTGRRHVVDPAERLRVARVNLAAGRKAKAAAAYPAAAAYLEAGIALIGQAHWRSDYELAFGLHLEAAECHYLTGAFDVAARYFARLEAEAATPLDRAHVHSLRIVLAENQGQWDAAVAIGRSALASFGLDLPVGLDAGGAALEREMAAIDRTLDGRAIGTLVDLPVLTDPAVRMALRILTNLWAPAYISGDPVLSRLISAIMVRLSLTHGNTEDSAYGYVTHAITVGPVRQQYAAAYAWGELALAVSERFGDAKRRAKIHQQFQAHVCFWCRPFDRCIPHAREAQRAGMENGDFTYAGYGAMSESWPAFLISRDLTTFLREYSPTLALLERLKMTDFLAAHRVMLAWARALQGRTAGRLSLSGDEFDEPAYLEAYEGRDPFFLMFIYAARLHLSVLLEEHEAAREAARRAREVAVAGTIWPVFIDFWSAMAAAATGDGSNTPSQDGVRRQLAEYEQSFAVLAANCPENFRCQALLVASEHARLQGDVSHAAALCEEAVAWARSTGNLQHEALAHEHLARMWRANGHDSLASAYLSDAFHAYAAWGAHAKTADLTRRYGVGAASPSAYALPQVDDPIARPPAGSAALDMATVVKLAHSIAVEVQVGGLLEKLMSLVLENAGANRGAFLQERDGGLVVVATAHADPQEVRLEPLVPLDRATDLAASVVRYVHRTRQDIALGRADADDRFSADPHIAARRVRSILCVPVVHQERPGGVLYLENTLTPDAFSEARMEMTRVLAAQAAISLENARLYEQMQDEVDRRTAAEGALREALAELQRLKERLEAENVYLQEEIRTQHNFNEIIGNSPALVNALRKVERVAPTEATVLILGETGSGKELFARAVHSRSARNRRPLVKVNCGAIAPGLVESELFGHVKGAFTGAVDKRVGRFELADGGTIFLDEVGELPPEAQVKLLRVLQEQEFEPVGSSRTIRVSVRVIAATNRNLEEAVREGTFRADLLYRLNVFPVEVPPLRERDSDIELLATSFLSALARKLGKPLEGFTLRTMQRMAGYPWPGNVRELQNVIERAAILAQGPVVDVDEAMFRASHGAARAAAPSAPETLDAAQRAHIMKVLAMTGGVVEGTRGAAAILGLHANTLRSRMKKLGISPGSRGPHRAS